MTSTIEIIKRGYLWFVRKSREHPRLAALGWSTFILNSAIYWLAVARGWFQTYPSIDIPLHFASCFATIILLIVYIELNGKDAFEILIILNILFEIGEMWQDKILPQPAYMKDLFFWDGFFDIVVGLAGAVVGWSVVRRATGQPILPWSAAERGGK